MKTIAELRADLRAKTDALDPLKQKALAENATAEDRAALKLQLDVIKAIEEQLALAEEAEAAEAKASRPATAPAGEGEGQGPDRVPAAPAEKTPYIRQLALVVGATFKAGKGVGGREVLNLLEKEGYGGFVKELEYACRVRGKAVNTLVSNQGGILVPAPLEGSIIPMLRPESTFLGANPTRVQLVNGQFKQPRGATGATAGYIAEGALKPVSTPTFDAISMLAKKLAGIVLITNEAEKWTVGAIADYIEADLRAALAQTMDLNAYFGTGAGASPVGIFNKTGVQTITPTFASATNPTLAELDAMANQFILAMTTNNLTASDRWRWVFAYRTALRLSAMRDGNGNLVFPELAGLISGQARWKGFPAIVSGQVATNLGAGTDETTIGLVDFRHVLFGEEEGITVKTSDQATIDTDGAGTLVHLFQQNMSAILAEMSHDFGLRYAKAVVKATGIRF